MARVGSEEGVTKPLNYQRYRNISKPGYRPQKDNNGDTEVLHKMLKCTNTKSFSGGQGLLGGSLPDTSIPPRVLRNEQAQPGRITQDAIKASQQGKPKKQL